MPTVTYLSDFHLEFYSKPIPYDKVFQWKQGDILCLAGDIGYPELPSYQTFMAYASSMFKYVFVIAGNHEYYQTSTHPKKTILSTNEQIKQICSYYPNVHFINNITYYMEEFDTYILGTTLWTETTGDMDEQYGYNDFKKIHNMERFGFMDQHHRISIAYLTAELDRLKKTTSKIIVMTHHLPSFQLIAPQYKDSTNNHLFATNLNRLFNLYKINHWICGHSHVPMQQHIQNTSVWMNPIGYPGEIEVPNWNAIFEL